MLLPAEPLRSILQLERKRDYNNTAVMGGLDRFLAKWAADARQSNAGPAVLTHLKRLDLIGSAYAAWDSSKRRAWVATILEWLSAGQPVGPNPTRERTSTGPPRVKKAPARPSKSATTSPTQTLDIALDGIKGCTPSICSRLNRLGVNTLRDLIYFFPRRHIDYSQRLPIANLKADEEQSIIANVWEARIVMPGGRRSTEVVVGDATGNMRAIWFNQPYLARQFPTNARIALSGRVTVFRGQKVFESPEWELVSDDDDETTHTGRLVPVYPLTHGLYPRQLRKLLKSLVPPHAARVDEFLLPAMKQRCNLIDLDEAIRQAHFPDSPEALARARRRLAFDELFVFQLGILGRKREWQDSQPGCAFSAPPTLVQGLTAGLRFTLTGAQQRVLNEILADLQQPRAMSRLLQGEVGSGKTAVAVMALLAAVANGYQGAFMAPTEILAEQHFNSIRQFLAEISQASEEVDGLWSFRTFLDRPIVVARLVGALSAKEKTHLHGKVRDGTVDIAVGTHALIEKSVSFQKLGLIVVDEQHRFGVEQRSALRQKGFNPHVLAMTATPIPRTMALTLYGDLDLSVIDEMPPGRQTVRTRWVYPEERDKAYDFVRRQVQEGRQAFIVCPLIEESESVEMKAAVAEYERLSQDVFPDLKLGLLHGKLGAGAKDEVMEQFRNGDLNILVSTSVVEVGIDVPNATVMMVEGADHFGLSQLHQFRGRVGRGKFASYCLLLAEHPTERSRDRLRLIERTHNGFVLAEEDLKMRGPGDFFGTRQSGLPDFRMAQLSDVPLLELARREAIALFQDRKALRSPEYRPLLKQLARMWPGSTEWS